MRSAEQGDTVRVHYTGMLEDGTVFDTSTDRDPLQFEIGKRQVIRGFEDAVVGLEEGQSTIANIAPQDGYGYRREELVLTLPRERMPDDLQPEVGQRLTLRQSSGAGMRAVVTDVSEESVTLDANHPLAGQQLTFTIQLVEVV